MRRAARAYQLASYLLKGEQVSNRQGIGGAVVRLSINGGLSYSSRGHTSTALSLSAMRRSLIMTRRCHRCAVADDATSGWIAHWCDRPRL